MVAKYSWLGAAWDLVRGLKPTLLEGGRYREGVSRELWGGGINAGL
jgi:hypothetical protein